MAKTFAAGDVIDDRRVLQIAIPIVISNMTVPLLGLVDTGVVGQAGGAVPIAAVGLGAIILAGTYWIFGFLRMGTAGMAAQAEGAGDRAEVCAVLMRALMISVTAGLVIIVLQVPFLWAVFWITPATPELETMVSQYLTIRLWGAPATISIFALTGWLIALERTRLVLVIQLWMNGLNIALDFLFVLGFGWGVEGVAVATLIAEWTSLALALWLCRDAFAGGHWRNRARVFHRQRLAKMAAVNSDIMIRSVLLEIGFISLLMISTGFGDLEAAANQVLMQFLFITAYGMDGFAFAAEAVVGQALGARSRARLRQGAFIASKWGGITVTLLTFVFILFGGVIIDLIAKDPDVRLAAREYLPWMIVAPFTGWAAWMLDGIFIGATRTADMRNAMIISFLIYVGAVIALVPPFQNHGLWAAQIVFFVARGITLALRYPSLERAADAPPS